jgi:predicted dehydrogenase
LLGAAATTFAAQVARARAAHGQGKRLRAGLVGCGWYGMVDLRHLIALGGADVVAMCDVDKNHLSAAADEVQKLQGAERPETFGDFREMLKPGKLDVVLVGSPDHWHALHAIAAMKAGADVYVQKPISHTYGEGRAMLAAARKLNRVVQVGTQRRSTPHIVRARELVKQGALGTIGRVRAYCYVHMRGNDNPPDGTPPAHLDYELWTGPAPMRPFNPLIHPKRWRMFSEYANGILGDMGIHMLDLARWFTGVGYPKRIAASGGIYVHKQGKFNVTDTHSVLYDYGDLTVTWEHRAWGTAPNATYPWAVTFEGDQGTLDVNLEQYELTPRDKKDKVQRVEAVRDPDPTKLEGDHVRPAGRAHMKDFVDAIASRKRPVADIEEGHISTALTQFGNIAQKVGRTLAWDAKAERFAGDEEASRLLRRAYRKGWTYPT